MAHEVVSWVLYQAPRELKSSDLIVALIFAEHASPSGRNARPSIRRVAEAARMSGRSVQRCVRRLEALGIMKPDQEATRYTATSYRFPGFMGDTALSPMSKTRGDRAVSRQGCHSSVGPGVTQLCRGRGDRAMTPEPSKEPSEEPLEERERGALSVDFQSPSQTPLPADWTPSEDGRAYALRHDIGPREIEPLVEEFKNYHEERENKRANWDAAWRRWVDKERRFNPRTLSEINSGATGKLVV